MGGGDQAAWDDMLRSDHGDEQRILRPNEGDDSSPPPLTVYESGAEHHDLQMLQSCYHLDVDDDDLNGEGGDERVIDQLLGRMHSKQPHWLPDEVDSNDAEWLRQVLLAACCLLVLLLVQCLPAKELLSGTSCLSSNCKRRVWCHLHAHAPRADLPGCLPTPSPRRCRLQAASLISAPIADLCSEPGACCSREWGGGKREARRGISRRQAFGDGDGARGAEAVGAPKAEGFATRNCTRSIQIVGPHVVAAPVGWSKRERNASRDELRQ